MNTLKRGIGPAALALLALILFQNITPLISLTAASGYNQTVAYVPKATAQTQPRSIADLVVYNPIFIDGNLDFSAENGVTGGNGTPEDPYIIEGWEINGNGTSNSIHIKNTDVHFTIRNVWVYNGNLCGIGLENVKNGVIQDSKTENNKNVGIGILDSHFNVISGNNISLNNGTGIAVVNSSSNMLRENIVASNNKTGIWFHQSHNNTVSNNNATSNGGEGINLSHSFNNTLKNNIITSNNNDGILSYRSSINMIAHNTATSNNQTGIRLDNSTSTDVVENIVIVNNGGIQVSLGSNNTIMKNNASLNNGVGIAVLWSLYNIVAKNNVTRNRFSGSPEYTPGIYLQGSNNNFVTRNDISDNGLGIYVAENCADNIISGNTIAYSSNQGIFLEPSCSNNRIYHNNFIQNYYKVVDGASNVWDYGEEGNYWSDYAGTDLDNNGIGDTPYFIDDNSQDNFPLMSPFEIEEVSAQITSCDIDSGTFQVGESVSATVTVENTGEDRWKFYMGFSVRGPAGEEWFDAPWTSIDLDVGASGNVLLSWQVVDSAPAGSYKARVAVWEGIDYSTKPPLLTRQLDRSEKEDAFTIQTGSPISMIGDTVKMHWIVPWSFSGYLIQNSPMASSLDFEAAFRNRFGVELSKEGEEYQWKVALFLELDGMSDFLDHLRFKWLTFFDEITKIKDVLGDDKIYRFMLVLKFGGSGDDFMSSATGIINICWKLSKLDPSDPLEALDLLMEIGNMIRNVFDVEWYFFKGSTDSLTPHQIFSLGVKLNWLIDKLETFLFYIDTMDFVRDQRGIRYLLGILMKLMTSGCFSEELDEGTFTEILVKCLVDFFDLTLGHIWIKPTLWQQFVMDTVHAYATWLDPPEVTMDLQVSDSATSELLLGYNSTSGEFKTESSIGIAMQGCDSTIALIQKTSSPLNLTILCQGDAQTEVPYTLFITDLYTNKTLTTSGWLEVGGGLSSEMSFEGNALHINVLSLDVSVSTESPPKGETVIFEVKVADNYGKLYDNAEVVLQVADDTWVGANNLGGGKYQASVDTSNMMGLTYISVYAICPSVLSGYTVVPLDVQEAAAFRVSPFFILLVVAIAAAVGVPIYIVKRRRKPKAKPPEVKPQEAEVLMPREAPPIPEEIPPKVEVDPKVKEKEEGIEYVFCIDCGAKVPRRKRGKEVRFCSKCGTRLYVGDVSLD